MRRGSSGFLEFEWRRLSPIILATAGRPRRLFDSIPRWLPPKSTRLWVIISIIAMRSRASSGWSWPNWIAPRGNRPPRFDCVCSRCAGGRRHDAVLFRCPRPGRHHGSTPPRGVDILTAQEDDATGLEDHELLACSTILRRVLFTQDIRFKALAEEWQRAARPFAGLIFGHQLQGSIGQYVRDLELIAKATDPQEWIGRVEKLPLG